MTLDESSQRLTAAIEAQDFPAIAEALKRRAKAIAELAASVPSTDSMWRAKHALQAGEAALQQLHSIQQRIVSEGRRLNQIRESFVENQRGANRPRVDCRG